MEGGRKGRKEGGGDGRNSPSAIPEPVITLTDCYCIRFELIVLESEQVVERQNDNIEVLYEKEESNETNDWEKNERKQREDRWAWNDELDLNGDNLSDWMCIF